MKTQWQNAELLIEDDRRKRARDDMFKTLKSRGWTLNPITWRFNERIPVHVIEEGWIRDFERN